MMNSQNSILYIGKAKNLKNRIVSYSRIKPGLYPDHLVEMIESIQSIKWKQCRTEADALLREMELLHAVRPPFNIAHTEPEHYLFIGIKTNCQNKREGNTENQLIPLSFQLSSHIGIIKEDYQVYGCFNHRRKIKTGYSALLRLLYAACYQGNRFSYPARLTRLYPPWIYSHWIHESLIVDLDLFLKGRTERLLHTLIDRLLENESIPAFMRPSIQEDIGLIRTFFRVGPKKTRQLAKKARSKILTHAQMDHLILSTI